MKNGPALLWAMFPLYSAAIQGSGFDFLIGIEAEPLRGLVDAL